MYDALKYASTFFFGRLKFKFSVKCKYYYMICLKNCVGGREIGEALVHTTRERHNFHYFGAVIKCVIQPIVMAMATEKIGITATDGSHSDGNGKQK